MSFVIAIVVFYILAKMANGFCKQFFTKRCLILFGVLVMVCVLSSMVQP